MTPSSGSGTRPATVLSQSSHLKEASHCALNMGNNVAIRMGFLQFGQRTSGISLEGLLSFMFNTRYLVTCAFRMVSDMVQRRVSLVLVTRTQVQPVSLQTRLSPVPGSAKL